MDNKLLLIFLFFTVLVSGCTVRPVDDGEALSPGNYLTLNVNTLREGVFDEEGRYKQVPVEGAFVEAIGLDNSNSYSCTTNEEGKCSRIGDFEPGKYLIRTSKYGCETTEFEKEFESKGSSYQFFNQSMEIKCEDWPFN